MEANTVEVHELHKRYGATVAVDGLSFTVRPGQVTGFVGPNGAGKSTTMRVILGLDAPDSGSALVGGHLLCSSWTSTVFASMACDATGRPGQGRHAVERSCRPPREGRRG